MRLELDELQVEASDARTALQEERASLHAEMQVNLDSNGDG